LVLKGSLSKDLGQSKQSIVSVVNFCFVFGIFPSKKIPNRASSHSELFAGDAATLTESLFDLNDLSSPDYNFFSSTSEFCTGFGLEEFYTQPATLAALVTIIKN